MKKPPIVIRQKSRKPKVEVVFEPEPNLTLIKKLPPGYAREYEVPRTAKKRAKIKYEDSWKL